MPPFIIVLILVFFLGFLIVQSYNSLVSTRNKCDEAFSTMDVYLKKRFDLIPNLVATVKGYAAHEAQTLEKVIQARNENPKLSVDELSESENQITVAMRKLFALSESYPELKANENFVKLQEQLQDVEDKIQAARRFYNAGAKELNTKIKTFPTNLINNFVGHFKKREYFEVEEAEKARIKDAPEVKF